MKYSEIIFKYNWIVSFEDNEHQDLCVVGWFMSVQDEHMCVFRSCFYTLLSVLHRWAGSLKTWSTLWGRTRVESSSRWRKGRRTHWAPRQLCSGTSAGNHWAYRYTVAGTQNSRSSPHPTPHTPSFLWFRWITCQPKLRVRIRSVFLPSKKSLFPCHCCLSATIGYKNVVKSCSTCEIPWS